MPPTTDAIDHNDGVSEGTQLVTLDFTDPERLAATVAQLDRAQRELLATAVDRVNGAEYQQDILTQAQAVLDEDAPGRTVIGIAFWSCSHPDDHYFDGEGTVLFLDRDADGNDTAELDFGGEMKDVLRAAYGPVGEKSVVTIDMRTKRVDLQGSDSGIYEMFSQFHRTAQ